MLSESDRRILTKACGGKEMTQELSWDDLNYLLVKVGGTIGIYTWREMSEWERLGIIWEWATKQEWWVKFITYTLNHEADPIDGIKVSDFCTQLVDPTRFLKLVTDFLREREGK